MTTREEILALARQFPVLQETGYFDDIKPEDWDPDVVDAWGGKADDGIRHAVAFILQVWGLDVRWKVGKFDVVNAALVWEKENTDVVMKWMEKPFLL